MSVCETNGGRFGFSASAFTAGLDAAQNAIVDLLADMVSEDELRAALARAREIRSLADFDARTAEIAAQSTANR